VPRWEYLTMLAVDLWSEHPHVVGIDGQRFAHGERSYYLELAHLGGLGWALVGSTGTQSSLVLLFKRPLVED
jgi:hypothetical protein